MQLLDTLDLDLLIQYLTTRVSNLENYKLPNRDTPVDYKNKTNYS